MSNKGFYYVLLFTFLVASAWIGYVLASIVKYSGHSRQSVVWLSIIGGAVVVGVGMVYFSIRHRHGEHEIPCKIKGSEEVSVRNYHFIMATSKPKGGMPFIKSTGMVSGIALELVNNDASPHYVRIEVDLNKESAERAVKEMVVDNYTASGRNVAIPFSRELHLEDISFVSIRVRQI